MTFGRALMSATVARPFADTGPSFTNSQIRIAFCGLMLGNFLATLDQTVVATALGNIGAALGDLKNVSWIVSIYLLTSTASTPIYGKLSDLHGRRPMLMTAISIFMVASVLCALAPTMLALVLARALQGIGGGGLLAMAHATIADLVSPRERGRWQGYIGGAFAAGNVLGPVLGGAIIQHAAWPWIFWLNVPICLLALIVIQRALRLLRPRGVRHRIDWAGSSIFTGAIACLIGFLVMGGNDLPWSDLRLWGLFALALVLSGLFIARQESAAEPVLPLRLFRNPVFTIVVGFTIPASMTLVGCIVLLPIFLIYGLGYTTGEASLLMISITIATVAAALSTGMRVAQTGRYKIYPLAGLWLATLTLLSLGLLATHAPSPLLIVIQLAAIGFGIGLSMPVALVAVQNAVETQDLGVATSCISFFRSLGGAIGVSLLTAIVAQTLVAGSPVALTQGHRGLDLLNVAGDAGLVAHGCSLAFLAAAILTGLAALLACILPERPLRSSPLVDAAASLE
ncbi:drug resistance transporter, EmrB/QacA subfamily [Arboricoccus pini]|uniref:Drug resistance transporter, EmrB/QacA subfamily n=1 Tax=Arboricoccus pini TaxID=1963835 RepID=A0A212RZN9_9PROT|nr:MFS transporter [Arboricoccus pini]SNB78297.1 drug resistance transporter, EmrB/QacA subfamily [Arboricoccus pini]